MNRSLRIAVRSGAWLCLLPVMGCCLVDSMVYPVPRVDVPEPPPPLKAVLLEGGVSAWALEPRSAASPVVVWCHGNGENLELMRQGGIFDGVSGLGAGMLGLNYPGYGNSQGSPGEKGVVAAVVGALREARRRWPGHSVTLVGWSLGSAAAIQAARTEAPDRLVVISPFTSLESMGRVHYNPCLVFFLTLCTRDTYDSLSAAASLSMPTLVIHGTRDEIIPLSEGVALSKAFPHAETLWIQGAGHNDILGFPEVWKRLLQ